MKQAVGRTAAQCGVAWLFSSGHLLAKAIRWAFVGVFSGAIYALVTAGLVSGLGAAPVPASIVGYCVSVPASFVGHRRFSFRSNGRWTTEAIHFVLVQAVNIAVTAGSMYAALHYFGSQYGWGMIAAVIFVPIANFLFMNLWIFADHTGQR